MGRDRTIPRWVLIGIIAAGAAALAFLATNSDDGSGQLTGIVTAVDGDLTEVRSFEVLSGGERLVFQPAPDGEFAFPLSHLRDHLRTGERIAVEYESVDGVRLAMRISDGQ